MGVGSVQSPNPALSCSYLCTCEFRLYLQETGSKGRNTGLGLLLGRDHRRCDDAVNNKANK